MAWARHGMCELTRHGMAWHGMGPAWARHGMCELAFSVKSLALLSHSWYWQRCQNASVIFHCLSVCLFVKKQPASHRTDVDEILYFNILLKFVDIIRCCLNLRSALFWDVTKRMVKIPCRRFGTPYRSHLQGEINPSNLLKKTHTLHKCLY
jgi:hypothetical protein